MDTEGTGETPLIFNKMFMSLKTFNKRAANHKFRKMNGTFYYIGVSYITKYKMQECTK